MTKVQPDMKTKLIEQQLTRVVIGAFYEVYNTLGFGFLEHIYVMALERELRHSGHQIRREVGVCVMYKDEELAHQRLDMIVDDKLIVEVNPPTSYTRQPAGNCTTTFAPRT
jgi:GxxExxY protein